LFLHGDLLEEYRPERNAVQELGFRYHLATIRVVSSRTFFTKR
jgi:hypothetical protein